MSDNRSCPSVYPDPFTSPQARELRRRIQALRIARFEWSEFVFRTVLEGLGYGTSLRSLPDYRLQQLYDLLRDYRPPRPADFVYGQRERKLYSLQKRAGWTDTVLRHFLTVTFQKTHLNLLTDAEAESLTGVLTTIINGG